MEGSPPGHAGLRRRRRLLSGVRGRWTTTWKGVAPSRTPSPRAGPRNAEVQKAKSAAGKKKRRARPFAFWKKKQQRRKRKERARDFSKIWHHIFKNPLQHSWSPKIGCTILECIEKSPKAKQYHFPIKRNRKGVFGDFEKKTQGTKFHELQNLEPCIFLDFTKLV